MSKARYWNPTALCSFSSWVRVVLFSAFQETFLVGGGGASLEVCFLDWVVRPPFEAVDHRPFSLVPCQPLRQLQQDTIFQHQQTAYSY
jgi:hypothetical protein